MMSDAEDILENPPEAKRARIEEAPAAEGLYALTSQCEPGELELALALQHLNPLERALVCRLVCTRWRSVLHDPDQWISLRAATDLWHQLCGRNMLCILGHAAWPCAFDIVRLKRASEYAYDSSRPLSAQETIFMVELRDAAQRPLVGQLGLHAALPNAAALAADLFRLLSEKYLTDSAPSDDSSCDEAAVEVVTALMCLKDAGATHFGAIIQWLGSLISENEIVLDHRPGLVGLALEWLLTDSAAAACHFDGLLLLITNRARYAPESPHEGRRRGRPVVRPSRVAAEADDVQTAYWSLHEYADTFRVYVLRRLLDCEPGEVAAELLLVARQLAYVHEHVLNCNGSARSDDSNPWSKFQSPTQRLGGLADQRLLFQHDPCQAIEKAFGAMRRAARPVVAQRAAELAAWLDHPAAAMRYAGAQALRLLGADMTAPYGVRLISMMADINLNVRDAAAAALGCVTPLYRGMRDPAWPSGAELAAAAIGVLSDEFLASKAWFADQEHETFLEATVPLLNVLETVGEHNAPHVGRLMELLQFAGIYCESAEAGFEDWSHQGVETRQSMTEFLGPLFSVLKKLCSKLLIPYLTALLRLIAVEPKFVISAGSLSTSLGFVPLEEGVLDLLERLPLNTLQLQELGARLWLEDPAEICAALAVLRRLNALEPWSGRIAQLLEENSGAVALYTAQALERLGAAAAPHCREMARHLERMTQGEVRRWGAFEGAACEPLLRAFRQVGRTDAVSHLQVITRQLAFLPTQERQMPVEQALNVLRKHIDPENTAYLHDWLRHPRLGMRYAGARVLRTLGRSHQLHHLRGICALHLSKCFVHPLSCHMRADHFCAHREASAMMRELVKDPPELSRCDPRWVADVYAAMLSSDLGFRSRAFGIVRGLGQHAVPGGVALPDKVASNDPSTFTHGGDTRGMAEDMAMAGNTIKAEAIGRMLRDALPESLPVERGGVEVRMDVVNAMLTIAPYVQPRWAQCIRQAAGCCETLENFFEILQDPSQGSDAKRKSLLEAFALAPKPVLKPGPESKKLKGSRVRFEAIPKQMRCPLCPTGAQYTRVFSSVVEFQQHVNNTHDTSRRDYEIRCPCQALSRAKVFRRIRDWANHCKGKHAQD
ncbi:hypothetical protein CYMTET_16128 [Cymbomonas tetramitiformis]|uniref:F-box domain-containing protein n=1 Tax=Cymbomonas tetramitiformis TaxID=36881 RepID=A0AAE0GCU3_9CHLO|nr:hypothetical protein CYMTET_16128 [Cymbomonas tetramitiformis]